jgi:dihydroorotase
VINEGYESTVLGLRGIPSISESVMVARELLLAEYTNAGIHIAHVSSEASVNLIRNAKKRGVKVTAETCPHYFSLTEDACENFNTLAKVNPPLKTQRDVDAIIEGLKDGTIDIIATDHAPHHADEKNVEFDLAAFGMVGFETALPLVITNLVTRGILSIEDIVMKMCYNPSKILSLNKGVIEEGRMADITIFDANEEQVININNFKSKSKNSPFNGFKLKGVVYHTIVNGKPVVREKVLL